MNEVAMRFLGTATIVGPIVLIILTIWIWFAFGTRAHALADDRRPTPWGWQCLRCPYGHLGASRVASRFPPTGVLSGIWRLPHRYLRRRFGTRRPSNICRRLRQSRTTRRPRGHSRRRTSNFFEHSSASRWSTTSSRPRTTTMTGNMNQKDDLTMRSPSRSPELARLALAKAWRDFRRKRIDGAMFSEIVNQCAVAIRRADATHHHG